MLSTQSAIAIGFNTTEPLVRDIDDVDAPGTSITFAPICSRAFFVS